MSVSEEKRRSSSLETKSEKQGRVWTFTEKRWWIYLTKNAEYEAVRQEEKRKTSEKVHGCSESGHRRM